MCDVVSGVVNAYGKSQLYNYILLAVIVKSIILKLHEFSTFLLAGLCEMVVHDMAKNPPP